MRRIRGQEDRKGHRIQKRGREKQISSGEGKVGGGAILTSKKDTNLSTKKKKNGGPTENES